MMGFLVFLLGAVWFLCGWDTAVALLRWLLRAALLLLAFFFALAFLTALTDSW